MYQGRPGDAEKDFNDIAYGLDVSYLEKVDASETGCAILGFKQIISNVFAMYIRLF